MVPAVLGWAVAGVIRGRSCTALGGAQGKRPSSSHVGPPGARGDREASCYAWRQRAGRQEIGLESEV